MCKFNQCLRALRKMSTKTYAIWKKLTTHCSFCVRILKTVIAVCTRYVWAWVNFVHNLRCLLKNLRSQQNFYATAGPTGPDKYHLWGVSIISIVEMEKSLTDQFCPFCGISFSNFEFHLSLHEDCKVIIGDFIGHFHIIQCSKAIQFVFNSK